MQQKQKIKNAVINLALVGGSLLLLFCLFEFVVFRFILKASDYPRVQTINQVIRHRPHQQGITRFQNEIAAPFRINADGWNSAHDDYPVERTGSKKRIAIIGDSYIEAFAVPYTQSVAEQLEQKLGASRFEVFRFGIGGAPLSQYLHMLRREVIGYSPDLVIIHLAHNDFDESYLTTQGLYDGFFMKLIMEGQTVRGEKTPAPYRRRWFSLIRYSATWRYLHLRKGISFHFLKDLLLGKTRADYRANIDVSDLDQIGPVNAAAVDYLFSRLKQTCDAHKAGLLLLMDGDRGRIYDQPAETPDYENGALRLNRMAKSIAAKYGIDFVDLHPVFLKQYRQNRKPFNPARDGHWNMLGHGVVAKQIYLYIQKNKLLLQ